LKGSVLITGGAGFVGSHVADELLRAGYRVRALDSLERQVHEGGGRPDYLDPDVELQVGDVRDEGAVRRALVYPESSYMLWPTPTRAAKWKTASTPSSARRTAPSSRTSPTCSSTSGSR
jgi:GDP-D-mannose dehydratase